MGLAAQGFQIFFKPPHPHNGADAAGQQPHAAPQQCGREHSQDGHCPTQAIYQRRRKTAAQQPADTGQGHDTAAHGFQNASHQFPGGILVQHRKPLIPLGAPGTGGAKGAAVDIHIGLLWALAAGNVQRLILPGIHHLTPGGTFAGGRMCGAAHSLGAGIHGGIHSLADGFIQILKIFGIDGAIDDSINGIPKVIQTVVIGHKLPPQSKRNILLISICYYIAVWEKIQGFS